MRFKRVRTQLFVLITERMSIPIPNIRDCISATATDVNTCRSATMQEEPIAQK